MLKDWEIHMKSILHVNTLLGKTLTKIKIQRLRNMPKMQLDVDNEPTLLEQQSSAYYYWYNIIAVPHCQAVVPVH